MKGRAKGTEKKDRKERERKNERERDRDLPPNVHAPNDHSSKVWFMMKPSVRVPFRSPS